MDKRDPISLSNPFANIKVKKGHPKTIKYCAWEVLRDFPEGLSVADLAKEIEGRDLRSFSGNKIPLHTVSPFFILPLYL